MADCKLADFNLAIDPPIRQIKVPAKFTGYTVVILHSDNQRVYLSLFENQPCLTSHHLRDTTSSIQESERTVSLSSLPPEISSWGVGLP